MGTLSLLQAAKIYWESLPEGYEGKRFYHISTDEVYGALQMTHPEGIPAPFTTKASSGKNHEAYGEEFFLETTKYNPHSPYSASKASSDHFVRAFHDTYGMPTIVTNCSNNYGPYQFPEKLIPLFINNIRHRKPLPVYGKGENVRDWLYVVDHARAIDSRKSQKELGWEPSLQFEEGIEETVKWYLFSKITPSLFFDKASCTRQFESELSLHSLASLFPLKEGSTSHPDPLTLREEGGNRSSSSLGTATL